jgi:hypothetical protein
MSEPTIRVYFRDHQHQQSYLSFTSESAASDHIRRVRDRLIKITACDASGQEQLDPELAQRLIAAAAEKI